MGRGSSATALRYCVSGINAATAPGSVEDGSDRLPHGGIDEPILGRPSGITDVGGSAQSKPFRQAVELSGRPVEPGVHREPINFLSGCPLLLPPTVPRPERLPAIIGYAGGFRIPTTNAATDALEFDFSRFPLAYGALDPILRERPGRKKFVQLFNGLGWNFRRAAILYR